MGQSFRNFDVWMVEYREYKGLSKDEQDTLKLFYDEYVNCYFNKKNRSKSLFFNDKIIESQYKEIKSDKNAYKEIKEELKEENKKRTKSHAKHINKYYKSYISLVNNKQSQNFNKLLKAHNKFFKDNLTSDITLNTYSEPPKKNRYKKLTLKEFIIVKIKRELNNKVNARRNDIISRDSFNFKTQELEEYINIEANKLTYIEAEFLRHLKTNNVILFVKNELVYLLECLFIDNKSEYIKTMRNDTLEIYSLYLNNKITKNKAYLFFKKSLEVIRILDRQKLIELNHDNNKVVNYLTNIYNTLIFKKSKQLKNLSQSCDI